MQNLGGKNPRLPPQHKYHSVIQTFPCYLLAKDSYILKAIIEETTHSSFYRHSKATPQSILNSKVESWNARNGSNTVSSSIFDDNIGEDGLSAQSMYEHNIDDSDYQNSLWPNQKLLHKVTTSYPGVKKIYVSVVRVINNLIAQISTKNTMTTNGEQGKSIKTNIAEVLASEVSCFPLDDIEFFEWTCTNKYGHLWYCPDISQSPILQSAIKKAIRKSWNYDTQCSLFAIESEGLEQRINQFVGFVTSHKKGNVLVNFHIHSFAVFYTEEGPSTIVTCLLTARKHILLNMQDQILQIVQLIQYRINQLFSMVIRNNFIGEEVTLDENSVCGYKMMGFKTMGEDEESNFSLRLEVPIPFSVFGDSYSWAKYGHHILPSILSISSRKKVRFHDSFWKCLLALLQMDLDGNLYSTPNCHTSAKIEVYLSKFFPSHLNNQPSGSMSDQLLEHSANTNNLVKFLTETAVGTTTIPLNLFTNLCIKRFLKHSFLESTLEIIQ